MRAAYLPVVYVSRADTSIPGADLERLAYDLGGVAHVVVEPSRTFSFRLRDMTNGRNAYGGAIALALPGRGLVRRLLLGFHVLDEANLLAATREAALALRGEMPAEGWDWTELQEQALRRQRERDRNRLTAQQTEAIYAEEVANLLDRIQQLESQRAARPPDTAARRGGTTVCCRRRSSSV